MVNPNILSLFCSRAVVVLDHVFVVLVYVAVMFILGLIVMSKSSTDTPP